MDNNIPQDRQDVLEDLIDENDLHSQAGLVCVGENEDGELEYVGTDKAWRRYEELSNLSN